MGRQLGMFLADMFLPLVVGYLLRRQGWLSPRTVERWLDRLIVVNIVGVFPVLGTLSLWSVHLNHEYAWFPLLGLVQQLVPGAIGYMMAKGLPDLKSRGSFVICSLLANRATLASLAVFILLGEQAYGLAQLAVLLEPLITFALAFPIAQYYERQVAGGTTDQLSAGKVLLNRNMLPVLAVLLGLGLNLGGVARPQWGSTVISYFIHLNGWSALLPIGFGVSFVGMRERVQATWRLAGIKFVAVPLITSLMVYPLRQDVLAVRVLLILALAPTAIFSVLTVRLHRLDVNLATAAFVVTTAVFFAILYPGLAVVVHLLG